MNQSVFERIKKEIEENDVVLYMKGTAAIPSCGYSAAVVELLSYMDIRFTAINVLEDEDVRQGIKEYAKWPTIPQLYLKGEFIGGCDIVRELYATGELQAILLSKGIPFRAHAA